MVVVLCRHNNLAASVVSDGSPHDSHPMYTMQQGTKLEHTFAHPEPWIYKIVSAYHLEFRIASKVPPEQVTEEKEQTMCLLQLISSWSGNLKIM
jgi:hypothetical protein